MIVDLIPRGQRNRPGLPLSPTSVTIHTTANLHAGAADHARYVKGAQAAARPASWHYTVGADGVYQHLPENEVAWHAGDGANGPGNRTSLAVEICEDRRTADGRIAPEVVDLAAELVADICYRYGWPPDEAHIVPHRKWSGKACPNPARLDMAAFRQLVAAKLAARRVANGQQRERTPILAAPSATVEQARAWLREIAGPEWVDLADLYWRIAPRYGVDPAVALAQAAHETGRFGFGGLVKAEQNNFCGLGATGSPATGREDLGGADPARVSYRAGTHGAWFADRATGVEAHVQHLYAYACSDPLPPGTVLVDPRFHLVRRGIAPYLEELGGRWAVPGYDRARFRTFEEAFAAGETYGQVIRARYLDPMRATRVERQEDHDPCADVRRRAEEAERRAAAAEERARQAEAEVERITREIRRIVGL